MSGTRQHQGTKGALEAGDGGDRDTVFVMVGVWQDQGHKAMGPGLWAGFSVGIFQKASHESRTEGWGSHRGSPDWSQVEGAKNLHLFSCSTSGPRDWHMCQHPSPCPCASRVPHSIQPHAFHPPMMPWGQAQGNPPNPGKGSVGGHRFTPQPTSHHRSS